MATGGSGSNPGTAAWHTSSAKASHYSLVGDGLDLVEQRFGQMTLALIDLEHRLLERLCRLHAVDLRLRRLVLRRRRPGGRRSLRLIEMERQRLGRELHTGVGQLLAAIRIQLEVAAAHLPDASPPVRQALDRVATLAAEALEQIRSISRRMYAPEWQRLPLDAALRQLWEVSGVAERFAGTVRIETPAAEPDLEVKTLLYRAAQEALSNIVRHSHASRVDVSLEQREGRLVLIVQDDGVGFDADNVFNGQPSLASGIGLRAIREQASVLGGKLLVESGPLGTKLEVSAPVRS